MTDHKLYCRNNNIAVYYTDTDSLAINRSLPQHFYGKELGKFLVECMFRKPRLLILFRTPPHPVRLAQPHPLWGWEGRGSYIYPPHRAGSKFPQDLY
jgi:hypothetical protein